MMDAPGILESIVNGKGLVPIKGIVGYYFRIACNPIKLL